MGFSLVAATAIISVAVFMGVGIMVESLVPSITDTNDSYDDMRDRVIDQVQTDITITSVTNDSDGPNYDLNITVENTGSVVLKTSYFDILVNGASQSFTCSNTYLYPEEVVYFNVTSQPNSGRLKVVADNGISDYYDYAI